MEKKVLIYKTIQTIEEEQYYTCSDGLWNKIKESSEEEKLKIWDEFNVWDSELLGEHSENWTEEEISHGVHHD